MTLTTFEKLQRSSGLGLGLGQATNRNMDDFKKTDMSDSNTQMGEKTEGTLVNVESLREVASEA